MLPKTPDSDSFKLGTCVTAAHGAADKSEAML